MPPKGGVKPPPPPLPKVRNWLPARIEDYIMEAFDVTRRPDCAGKVLALVVELHLAKKRKPFPTRKQVAEEYKYTVWGVDAALAQALGRGLILQHDVALPVQTNTSRETVKRERYYIPTDKFLLGLNLEDRIPSLRRA